MPHDCDKIRVTRSGRKVGVKECVSDKPGTTFLKNVNITPDKASTWRTRGDAKKQLGNLQALSKSGSNGTNASPKNNEIASEKKPSNTKNRKETSKPPITRKSRRIIEKSQSENGKSDVNSNHKVQRNVKDTLKDLSPTRTKKHKNQDIKKSFTSKLRNRRLITYKDVSKSRLDESSSENINLPKVPIYKQTAVGPKNKPGLDEYEFIFDSEKPTRNKKDMSDDLSFRLAEKDHLKASKKNKKKDTKSKKKRQVGTKTTTAAVKSGANNHIAVKTRPEKDTDLRIESHKKDLNTLPTHIEVTEEVVSSNKKNSRYIVDESDDNYFGFSEPVKSPKVHLHSSIVISPPKETQIFLPNANSTMNNVFSPWRFNEINITRNPHFLTLKQSSLPCISQDLVLDHTLVDKLNDSIKCQSPKISSRNAKVPKTPKQTSIVDYLGCTATKDKENYSNCTLFDVDQFSPAKNSTKTANRGDGAKRRVLAEMSDNIIEIHEIKSPLKANPCNYFGFSNLEDSILDSPRKPKDDKPFRLSININDKKYVHKKKNVIFNRMESPIDHENDSWGDDIESEHEMDIQLFEDFKPAQHDESTNLKSKRNRKYNLTADYDRIKKKKDTRTKAEKEAEAEWAKNFNALCEEIEEFPLEIE